MRYRGIGGFADWQTLVAIAACLAGFQGAKPVGHYTTSLLRSPVVRRDMRISAPVQQKLDLIEASSTRMIMAYSKILREGKPPLKKVKAVGVALKHYQQEELALLTRTQRARLLELSLQEGDASELEDPSVAKALGLSRSQVEALDRADGAEVGKMLRTLPKDPSEKLKWYMSAQKTRQANIDEAVQKILTVPQMRAWTKMKGRPLPMFEAKSVRSTM